VAAARDWLFVVGALLLVAVLIPASASGQRLARWLPLGSSTCSRPSS
jgi:hypothetical protein